MLTGVCEAQQTSYMPGYLRLHVIGASDSEEDQNAKLLVRDAILAEAANVLEGCDSAEEACKRIEQSKDIFIMAAESACKNKVRLETGVFVFPDRQYGDMHLPSGDYLAVRVILGKGEGKNWWCVLYPGMCMPEEIEKAWKWKRVWEHWFIWRGGSV